MTPENFCYWLKGWFELNETIDHRDGATKETLAMMKSHLDLVFTNVTADKTAAPNIHQPLGMDQLEKLIKKYQGKGPMEEKEEQTRYC